MNIAEILGGKVELRVASLVVIGGCWYTDAIEASVVHSLMLSYLSLDECMLFGLGMLLGFAIAAPVGPIGALCIHKTLMHGRASGLVAGLGAALADMLYACIAVFGFAALSDFFLANHICLRLVGGVFLLYLGIKTFFSNTLAKVNVLKEHSLVQDFFSTFFLTMTSPLTLLALIAMTAGLGLSDIALRVSSVGLLAGGVFVGSGFWWLVLSEGITLFRKRLGEKAFLWMNRGIGMLLFGFGLFAWASCAF